MMSDQMRHFKISVSSANHKRRDVMVANQMTYSKTSASSASDIKEVLAFEVMASQMRYPKTSAS